MNERQKAAKRMSLNQFLEWCRFLLNEVLEVDSIPEDVMQEYERCWNDEWRELNPIVTYATKKKNAIAKKRDELRELENELAHLVESLEESLTHLRLVVASFSEVL